jgi:predicted GNAT superfamily acetyltransferase
MNPDGFHFTELAEHDLEDVLVLNNNAVPATSELDLDELVGLHAMSSYALGIRSDNHDGVIGFCLNLDPGSAYQSLNYRWFAERYESFTYLDRIVVHPDWRNRGIGAAMYGELERRIGGRVPWLFCEVNIRPMNADSLRFHHRLGFVEVGQQHTEGGNKTVSLLAKKLR